MIINANSLHPFPLADQSVHCAVTSPPYWGLRDYGTATWQGGDAECEHIAGMARNDTQRETPGGKGGSFRGGTVQFTGTCGKCGAVRVDHQLGLEATPAEYVAHMVAVFAEVWRVLRDDGTLWLNLGDSYNSIGHKKSSSGYGSSTLAGGEQTHSPIKRENTDPDLKHKDKVGIPWRVAFALQEWGWYLRSDIIWSKPNPMPESVTDRPTQSHEYLFLLAKQERYYYDEVAVREPIANSTARDHRLADPNYEAPRPERGFPGGSTSRGNGLLKPRSSETFKRENSKRETPIPGQAHGTHQPDRDDTYATGYRNRRSVWTIATAPYSGAHFATFPPALVEPCILAGCPTGGIVLDPFAGSGTTGAVARKHGRRFVGLDLNATYLRDLALPRAEGKQTAASIASLPLFAGDGAA